MKKYLLFLCIPFLLGSCSIFSRNEERVLPTLSYSGTKVDSWTLENGLKAHYFKHTYPEKRVELRVVVKAGSAYEKPEEKGIAHFIEHMVFNGTQSYPAGEVAKQMETLGNALGNDVNAFTIHDATVYHLQVKNTKEDVELAMKMLSEFVGKPTFAKEEVEKEKGVVLAEKRERSGVQNTLRELVNSTIFQGTSYADPVIGTQETISAFTPEMLRSFWKSWYRPDRMEVSVVGDIEKEQVQDLVSRYFGSMEKVHDPLPELPRAAVGNPVWKAAVHEDATSTQVRFLWMLPPEKADTVEDMVATYKDDILVSLLSMRLGKMVDEERLVFQSGSAYLQDRFTVHNKAIVLDLAINKGKEQEAIRLLQKLLLQFRNHSVEEKEFAFIQNTYKNNIEQSMKNSDSISVSGFQDSFVDSIIYALPLHSILEECTYMLQLGAYVRVEDINAVKASMLDPKNAFALWMSSHKEPLSLEPMQKIFEDTSGTTTAYTFVEPRVQMMELPQSPEIQESKDYASYEAKEIILTNGVRITAKHTTFDKDNFLIKLDLQGGKLSYTERDVAVFQRLLSYAHIPGISRNQLTDMLQSKGIFLQVAPGEASTVLMMGGPAQEKELMLQVVYSLLNEPSYGEAELEKVREDLAKEEEVSRKKDQPAVNAALGQLIWPGEKTRSVWLEEERKQLSLEKIRKIQKDIVRAPHVEMTLVGSLPQEEMYTLAGRFFTTMKKQEAYAFSKEEFERPFSSGVKEGTIYVGTENKAGVHLRFPGPAVDDVHAQAVSMVLTSLLQTAMNDRIREELGEVYSTNVFQRMFLGERNDTYYALTFIVDPKHLQTVEDAAWKVIEDRRKKGFSAEEILRARMPLTTQIAMAKKMNMFWLSIFQSAYTGYPKDLIFQVLEELPKVTVEDIRTTLATSFQKTNYVKVIQLPKK